MSVITSDPLQKKNFPNKSLRVFQPAFQYVFSIVIWQQHDCTQFILLMPRRKDDYESSEDYSQDQKEQQKVEIRKPKIERIDKFKTLKKIVINVSMTQYPVVQEVAEELGWKIQYSNEAGDWDVFWTDYAIDPDVLIKMHLFQKINHYPGIHTIARKNLLGINLMALRNHFPDQYDFFPLTWMLPLQYADFRNYFENKPKGKCRTYIVKPEADCQGRGIFLTRKLDDLQNGKHYVIQRYLARPYLIDGLKFDLRIYVLLCGTNPLRLYMFHEGLARLATEQYIEPCNANLDKQYMHLTNYAINKHNPKFVFNNSSKNMGIGHKRSLTAVFKQLAAKGMDIERLKQQINDIAIKTLISGLPLMSHQYKCSQPQDYSGNMCFHILGLDIMLNNKGDPILLEVNHTPSFTTDTPLDQKIKFNLIKDSLKLMNVNVHNKTEMISKCKDIGKERLLTGKRHIFQGKEREQAVENAQRARDQYEAKHLGGFTKIFPVQDQEEMKKYNEMIQKANKIYMEENGSVRVKMMEKEAKKLIKEDQKMRKKVAPPKAVIVEKQALSEPELECLSPLSPTKQNFTSQHYISHKDETIEEKEEEDYDMTISEQIMPAEIAEMPVKAKSQKEDTETTLKVRKIAPQPQPQRQEIRNKQSRLSENKLTPQHVRKAALKEPPIHHTPSHFYQNVVPPQPDRNRSNILSKPTVRRQNTRGLEQLPNLSESPHISNVSTLLRRENHPRGHTVHSQMKGTVQAGQRGEMRGQRIYDHIAEDIRNMITCKNNTNGGYVMPKLINLNLDSRLQQSPMIVSNPRRPNPNIQLFVDNNQ